MKTLVKHFVKYACSVHKVCSHVIIAKTFGKGDLISFKRLYPTHLSLAYLTKTSFTSSTMTMENINKRIQEGNPQWSVSKEVSCSQSGVQS